MDSNMMYYGGLVLIAILAWMSYQNDKMLMTLIFLGVGAYFIYSHNTGNTVTDFTHDTVDSINEKI